MTKTEIVNTGRSSWISGVRSLLLLCPLMILGIFMSEEISEYTKEGMRLAIECVIPTSLPFMLLSDIYVVYGHPENIRLMKGLLESALGVPEGGIAPFICGNVCGFPIGAKMIADEYESGALTKAEAERLIPLCNNPSCAFIVGGVGLAIYGDIRVGFLLLSAVYISTIICCILTRSKPSKKQYSSNFARQKYDFTNSVKRAGISSVGIISFISIFSVISGIIKRRVKNAPMLCLILSFLEVTNAAKSISELACYAPSFALVATAFTLGFGGLSVGMQSSIFSSSAKLSMKKYYLIKLLEALISAGVTSLLIIFKG